MRTYTSGGTWQKTLLSLQTCAVGVRCSRLQSSREKASAFSLDQNKPRVFSSTIQQKRVRQDRAVVTTTMPAARSASPPISRAML